MHRAGVSDPALRIHFFPSRALNSDRLGRPGRSFIEKRVGIVAKLLEAMDATEIVRLAVVLKRAGGSFRRDSHPANRIESLIRQYRPILNHLYAIACYSFSVRSDVTSTIPRAA